jgi:hypothetical protein
MQYAYFLVLLGCLLCVYNFGSYDLTDILEEEVEPGREESQDYSHKKTEKRETTFRGENILKRSTQYDVSILLSNFVYC